MNTLWQDLRYAFRGMLRRPAFTLAAVLTLALGIGANTAVFSVVNAVLLRQLPFRDPGRLVVLWCGHPGAPDSPTSIPDFLDLRERSRTIEQFGALGGWNANLTGDGEPERIPSVRVSGNYFDLLGVQAVAGRALAVDDDRPGADRVVVISYGLWLRRFGGDRSVIGRPITLNGTNYTVAGVLPAGFFFPVRLAEMATPIRLDADPRRTDRADHYLRVIARVKPGIAPAQARAELSGIARDLQRENPVTNAKSSSVSVHTLQDELVGNFRRALWILLAAVAMVLLIACANLGNLLLVRAAARQKEMAIRTALGASRGRLVRQLLCESAVVALAGGLCGVGLAAWGVKTLAALVPADLPRAGEISLDGSVLGFTIALSLLAGIVFGLAPAIEVSRTDLNETLNGEARGSTGGAGRNRARNLLVISEVALSLVLLTGAGLLLRSFARLESVNPGFDSSHLLVLRISLPQSHFPDRESLARFNEALLPKILNLPGVDSAGAVNNLPLSGQIASVDFSLVDRPPARLDEVPTAEIRAITPGYLKAMRIPLVEGRLLDDHDMTASTTAVLVNRNLARQFWPGASPLGAHLNVEDIGDVEIAGVIEDVKHHSLEDPPSFDIYVPYHHITQNAVVYLATNTFWVVRTGDEPLSLAAAVRREIRSVDPDVAASTTQTMDHYLSAAVAPRRFNLILLGLFAVAALLLASTGIYAVISYSVTQRTREIGIRAALGASSRNILGMVLGQGMRLALVGVSVGLAVALLSSRVISSLLFGIGSSDPATFIGVSVLLVSVALLACYVPARRATRVDAIVAMREES